MKTIRVLAISLTLGVWGMVSVDGLNAKQIAQSAHSRIVSRSIVDRSSDGTINLVGPQQQHTLDCRGNAVQITGNGGNITLQGTCSKIVLVGNNNVIQVKTVGFISVTGNDNRIRWQSGIHNQSPQVLQSGDENIVVRLE